MKNKKESIYDKKMKNPKFKKLLEEGYKEMAKEEGILLEVGKGKEFETIDEMLDAPSRYQYTYLDYIEIYFNRYIRNPIEEAIRYVKRFWQRGLRGYASSDTWSFDYYLATVISQGIKHLLKYGNSCWTKKDLKALKMIVKTFETVIRIEDDRDRYIPSKEFTWKEYKKAKRHYKVMQKKYKGRYHVMTLREVRRFEKGFDLFKEYYFHLWD